MKKLIAILAYTILASALFAEKYTVTAISGRARSTDGAITIGQVLDDETVISISGVRDTIHLDYDKIIRGPKKNIKVKDAIEVKTLKKTEIKNSKVGKATKKNVGPASTAASRASDAKADLDWAE